MKHRPRIRVLTALTTAVAVAVAAVGCGGASSDGQGGRSSSGGGSAVTGVAVIGLGIWMAKSLLAKVGSDAAHPAAAIQTGSFRIGTSNEFKTQANLGYIALNTSDDAQSRNKQLCRKFLEAVAGAQPDSQPAPASSTAITVWTILVPNVSFDRSDCRDLLHHYDYDHSIRILQAAKLNGGRGPFLVSRLASSEKPQLGVLDRPLLVWDLSPIESRDFGLVLQAWAMMQMISFEELKKAIAQASVDETVERIAGIAASRAYRRSELLISIKEQP